MKSLLRRIASSALLAGVLLPLIALAGPNKGAGHANFPNVNLAEVVRGQRAIQALGAHLPEVARVYGMSADDLRKLLAEDSSAAVDPNGRLLYTDPRPEPGAVAESTVAAGAVVPLADTFKLHSRPGAKRIIYLDFDGHVISGTGWNTSYNGGRDIIAPPWDIDGNPGSFSDTERTRIQQIWQRVAEDFAAFDVDVTTELTSESLITRSSTSDEFFGTRVLISAISSYFGNYGGIAYVGAFDDIGDQYKPALVFPENLGPNVEKYIAEAVTHEAGHNLGLNHDGTTTGQGYYAGHGSGNTSWAPIMGNSYSRNVTQWSKGEYANANNKQDDLAVMQTYGMPHRLDDHGNTASAASYFPAGTQLSASGIIERNTDVDVFAFTTGAGAISIAVAGRDIGSNLDILTELRDANGALVASINPLDQLHASFNLSVAAGTYFLHVRGTGFGDPLTTGYSSYSSIGQYWIAGTVVAPAGNVAPVANIKATPTTGTAPLVVQFDGTGSFDQDGSIVSYAWSFGDGTTGSGATVSRTYSAAGSYTVTLTVTDNNGLTGSSSVVIQVQQPANIAPVARIAATPVSGTAPLTVTFDGSSSTDADGSISSYQWNFGNGASASGAVVQYTYQSAGTYTATLTVTDNRGATATASVVVQVSSSGATTLRVQSISLGVQRNPAGDTVRATVRVTNLSGTPISGVAVTGSFSGLVNSSATATTDVNGYAVLASPRAKKGSSGTVTFQVTNLARSGYTYSPSNNVQSSATISLAR